MTTRDIFTIMRSNVAPALAERPGWHSKATEAVLRTTSPAAFSQKANELPIMSRKRHHYVPRFLLSRFASRREDEKSWVWQITDDNAIEISTKDAAVSKHFYGQDTAIEDALVPLEGASAVALSRVDAGDSLENHREALRGLFWTLIIRGRSVRDQFAGSDPR